MLSVHRHLRVVALLESLVARLHDPAFRVREVALRLLVRLAIRPLVRSSPLRVSSLARLPTARVVRRPLRRLQPRLRRPDRRHTILPPPQLRRQLVAPYIHPQPQVLGQVGVVRRPQQLVDLAGQTPFLLLHPTVAHRLALARVRAHLRPVDRQLPEPCKAQLASQTDHLDEQLLEIVQVPPPKLADRPVLREVARRQHPERHVLFQLPRNPTRRKHTRRVGVEQHLHQHPRLIRRVATPVALVPRVERRQIQPVHQIADMVRQMALRQPLPYIRRQQQRLLRCVAAECRRHQVPSSSGSSTIVASRFLRRRLLAGSARPRKTQGTGFSDTWRLDADTSPSRFTWGGRDREFGGRRGARRQQGGSRPQGGGRFGGSSSGPRTRGHRPPDPADADHDTTRSGAAVEPV